MVITLAFLWYVGNQNKQEREAKLKQYQQEIITKERNLESVIKNSAESNKANPQAKLEPAPNTTKTDIIVAQATGTEAVKQYGRDLIKSLNGFSIKRDNEIKAMISAMEQNQSLELKAVVSSRLVYEEAANLVKQVAVPAELADQHRQLLGNLNNSVKFLRQMELVLDQPKIALQASSLFLKESVMFYQNIDKINNYFNSLKIDFAPNEKLPLYINMK